MVKIIKKEIFNLKINDNVWSPFGYGKLQQNTTIEQDIEYQNQCKQINQQDEQKIELQNKSKETELYKDNKVEMIKLKTVYGAILYTENKNLYKKIYIQIKTFYGDRIKYREAFDVNSTINDIKQQIIQKDKDQKSLYDIKLIYPMGFLKELKNNDQKLCDLQIGNESNLILLAKSTFCFDNIKKGNNIKLSNQNLTASKKSESDYQSVLGSIEYFSGRHYWEIKIDKYVEQEDLFIGIAKSNINLYQQPTTNIQFYGFIPMTAQKFSPKLITSYGQPSKLGDVIGVLLEFKNEKGTLSFYKNSQKLGVAFSLLEGSFHPAVSMFYGEVTLNPKATIPL